MGKTINTTSIKVSKATMDALNHLRWPRASYNDIIALLIAYFKDENGGVSLADMRNLALTYHHREEDRQNGDNRNGETQAPPSD